MTLAEKLNKIIDEQNISKREFAKRLGMSEDYVYLLTGNSKNRPGHIPSSLAKLIALEFGYDEEWIIKRIKGIQDRKKLTDTWKNGGVTEEVEFAILTNDIYKEWSGMTSNKYKQYKGLKKESLRDNMNELEIALADIGELTTRKLAEKHKPVGLDENRKIAKEGGQVASNTRKDIELRLGESVVTQDNALDYKYIGKTKEIETK